MLHLDRSSKLICEPGEPGACLLIKAHMITIAHLIHEHIYIYTWHKKQDFIYFLLHAIFYHPISNAKAHLKTNMH